MAIVEDSNLKKIRLDKIQKLENMGINPFPYSYNKTHTIAKATLSEGKNIKTAGRLLSFREHGNIAFADLMDETGKIQIFFQKKLLGESFKNLKLLDIGDFIGVQGEVGKTVAGEISVIPASYVLLSKSLRTLPNEWYGLKDTEIRYRQRFLDLILNPEVRERFNVRTKLISGVREYLDNLGFWEVETPALQVMYGGTNAKPFTTHLNALDQDMYLRIAVELYIKRLIAGGYEKVYEIAKDFRNEGIDNSHFPEFTMIEWYEAYVDYQVMMDRAEGMLKFLAKGLFGNTILNVEDKKIDIGKVWPRISMVDIMKDKLNLDVEKKSEEELREYLETKCPDVGLIGTESKGQLIFTIFDHLIPKLLKEPTWIIDYPQEVSPLARPHRSKKGWVERYEGYVGGKEIFDGWTEITNPSIQRAAWEADMKAARKDNEEAQHVDEDFLTAMEYGMPPYGGIGVGIDRLTMLFTNTWTIKELILFPTLKRDEVEKKEITKDLTNISKNKSAAGSTSKQDFSRKFVIVLNKDLPSWQAMNALGHISAYLGNKMNIAFDTGVSFDTKDRVAHPRNTQYPIIALSADSVQLKNLSEKARNSGLLYHGFIREMIETTDDKEIAKILENKTEQDIEYLGVGLFGLNEEVEKLTKNYNLYGKEIKKVEVTSAKKTITRNDAYKLLTTYIQNKNLLKHCLAAEVAMKGIYNKLHEKDFNNETEEQWGITGLLHDIDYEVAQRENKLDKHGILLFEKDSTLVPEPMAHAIKSHNYTMTGVDPESDLDWAITCVDGLTGLVVSSTLISPNKKISSIDAEFVLKRFNSPSFSKGVNRFVIKMCEEKLGIPLIDFINITLTQMQGISDELGL